MAVTFHNGYIADTPATASDGVRVSVPNLTQLDRIVYGPLPWEPKINSSGDVIAPTLGDKVLIADDDSVNGSQWIVNWNGERIIHPAIGSGGSATPDAAKGTINAGSQTIATGNNAVIALASEDFDTNTIHDPTTNNSRLTTKTDGYYDIVGFVRFSAAVTGLVTLEVLRNGSTPGPNAASTTNSQYLNVATQVRVTAGDYLELRVTNASGATVTIANAWLSAILVPGGGGTAGGAAGGDLTGNYPNPTLAVNNSRVGRFAQATAGTRANAAYGDLSNGPDRVNGLVVAANQIIRVHYHAIWSAGAGDAKAAIFIITNPGGVATQLKGEGNTGGVSNQEAGFTGSVNDSGLDTSSLGLTTQSQTGTAEVDVTTGQVLGHSGTGGGGGPANVAAGGGAVSIFGLAAGTYDIAVRFLQSAGTTVTVKNRLLVCEVI